MWPWAGALQRRTTQNEPASSTRLRSNTTVCTGAPTSAWEISATARDNVPRLCNGMRWPYSLPQKQGKLQPSTQGGMRTTACSGMNSQPQTINRRFGMLTLLTHHWISIISCWVSRFAGWGAFQREPRRSNSRRFLPRRTSNLTRQAGWNGVGPGLQPWRYRQHPHLLRNLLCHVLRFRRHLQRRRCPHSQPHLRRHHQLH